MGQGDFFRRIKAGSRRVKNRARGKIRIGRPIGITAAVLTAAFFLTRLMGGIYGKLWENTSGFLLDFMEEAGRGLILGDKALLQYLAHGEEERGPFRTFSEDILGDRLYMADASINQGIASAEKSNWLPQNGSQGAASTEKNNWLSQNGSQGAASTEKSNWSSQNESQGAASTEKSNWSSQNESQGAASAEKNNWSSQNENQGASTEKNNWLLQNESQDITSKNNAWLVLNENQGITNTEKSNWQEYLEEDSTDPLLTVVEDGLLEHILSENEAWEKSFEEKGEDENEEEYLPVSYVQGNVTAIEKPPEKVVESSPIPAKSIFSTSKILLENHYSIKELSNVDYLLSTYYIVDSITRAIPELFNAEKMLSLDLSLNNKTSKEGEYQILIYHTHASEDYSDSRPGEVMDTVRGPAEALAEYLRAYGYSVYHDMTAYDRKDGKDNRNYAYSTARPSIEAFLAEHPEVEVVIDLHRDSGDSKRVAVINGKETARVMLFNGLCRNASGPIADLENPNLQENLAFSLQINLTGRVLYPDLMFRIYLKNYRYNQHFRQRCLLVELGTNKNTVQEAYNAMEPFAEVLDAVLRK